MKKNNNTGELVINYLATCGKKEVETLDLVKAVVPGCQDEEEMDQALGRILPVLTNLESGGLVSLSTEAIPATGSVPKRIRIMPRMIKATDRLMHDKINGGKSIGRQKQRPEPGEGPSAEGGRKSHKDRVRKQDAISCKFYAFVDLYEKKRNLIHIRGEWNRLVSSMIYFDIEEEIGSQACAKAFVNGLIWQKRKEQEGSDTEPVEKQQKIEPQMQPGLLSQIDEIIKADEEKNGKLKGRRMGRGVKSDADVTLVRLGREEVRDFMHCIHNMRDEVQPDRLCRDAVSRFMAELLAHMPVHEACMEAFKAGIIWQMHRKKLED